MDALLHALAAFLACMILRDGIRIKSVPVATVAFLILGFAREFWQMEVTDDLTFGTHRLIEALAWAPGAALATWLRRALKIADLPRSDAVKWREEAFQERLQEWEAEEQK